MPRWRKARMGKMHPGDAAEAVFTVPDFGGLDDLGVAVLALLAVVVVAIVVIPLGIYAQAMISSDDDLERLRLLVEGDDLAPRIGYESELPAL